MPFAAGRRIHDRRPAGSTVSNRIAGAAISRSHSFARTALRTLFLLASMLLIPRMGFKGLPVFHGLPLKSLRIGGKLFPKSSNKQSIGETEANPSKVNLPLKNWTLAPSSSERKNHPQFVLAGTSKHAIYASAANSINGGISDHGGLQNTRSFSHERNLRLDEYLGSNALEAVAAPSIVNLK